MVESRAVLGGVGDEARQWYVEEIGLIFERGVPRMVGRVLGVLVISEVPELSAEELAGEPGPHKHHDAHARADRYHREGGQTGRVPRLLPQQTGDWHDVVRRELGAVSVMRRMAEEGLEMLNSSDPEARRGLEEMLDIYDIYVFARWEKESKEKR